jgi:hypothetical protein
MVDRLLKAFEAIRNAPLTSEDDTSSKRKERLGACALLVIQRCTHSPTHTRTHTPKCHTQMLSPLSAVSRSLCGLIHSHVASRAICLTCGGRAAAVVWHHLTAFSNASPSPFLCQHTRTITVFWDQECSVLVHCLVMSAIVCDDLTLLHG